MLYKVIVAGVIAASVAGAPAPVEDRTSIERDLFGDADADSVAANRGRELFPVQGGTW